MTYSKSILFSMVVFMFSMCLMQSCGTSSKVAKIEVPEKSHEFAFDFVKSEKLQPVLDLAAKEGKLVFLDIYTTWCLPCQVMEESVFRNQSTADKINANFISYKVDAEKPNGLNLGFVYEVNKYPTLLFLDAQGNVLNKKEGGLSNAQFLDVADVALQNATASD